MTRAALILICALATWPAFAQDVPPRPQPDPSPRTVEQLYREIQNLEDKFNLRDEANKEAVRLLQEFANRQPTAGAVDSRVIALKELTHAQFEALKELITAKADAVKTSLDAALVSRKEEGDKLASSVQNQFGAVNTQFNAVNTRIDDLKERIDTGEGRGSGRDDIIAWIVAGVAVLGFIITQFKSRRVGP